MSAFCKFFRTFFFLRGKEWGLLTVAVGFGGAMLDRDARERHEEMDKNEWNKTFMTEFFFETFDIRTQIQDS